jgi:hypothetical protein
VNSDVSDEQLRKQYLGEGVKIPDLATRTVKNFFHFHAALCKLRILNILFTDSLNSNAEQFFSGVKYLTGIKVSKDFRSKIFNVSISTILRAASDKDDCP